MTQQDRILEYIKTFGSITPLEAFRDIGCTRLGAQIFELEKKGYEFDHIWQTSENRFGEKTRYMRYSFKFKD